jgi:ABC-type phosphate transport system substrate-binding protein
MVGIVGYAQMPRDSGIVASQISTVAPTLDAIVNDTYPASRSLYIYIHSWRAWRIEANAITVFSIEQGVLPDTYTMVPADPTRARGTPNTNPIKLLDLKL